MTAHRATIRGVIFAAAHGFALCFFLAGSPAIAEDAWDPIEPVNRKIFWFNDQLDEYVVEPVARGYDYVMPDFAQKGIGNFLENLRTATFVINNVLQWKPKAAGTEAARFTINVMIGFLGTIDVATEMGIEARHEDFGQTLGYWGVPGGPYLVFPAVGPSNARDGVGIVVDSYLTSVYPLFISGIYTVSLPAVSVVNTRSQFLDDVDQVKDSTFDYYVTARDGYTQRRRALINDSAALSEAEQQELYYEDFDD